MQIVANRVGFQTALEVAASVIPSKPVKDILRNIKILVSPGDKGKTETTLMATDMENGIRYRVSGVTAHTDTEVSALLPAAKLTSILREMTDDEITIDIGNKIRIIGNEGVFNLGAQDPKIYPDVPEFKRQIGHGVKAGDIVKAIKRVAFAASNDGSRFALHAVLFDFVDDQLRLVGTDGKRMAYMPMPVEIDTDIQMPQNSVLVLPKALSQLPKILIDPEERIDIDVTSKEILFRSSKMTLYSRLAEGRYPNYGPIMTPGNTTIPLVAGKTTQFCRQTRVLTTEETRGVDWQFDEGILVGKTVSGSDNSEIRLPVGYDGEPITLIFDPLLFLDALRNLDAGTTIMMHVSEPTKPIVNKTDDGYVYVIMPIGKKGND